MPSLKAQRIGQGSFPPVAKWTWIRRAVPALLVFVQAGLIFVQTGCVALNIPSHRFSDPQDGGGILGHWSRPRSPEVRSEFPPEVWAEAAGTGVAIDALGGGAVPCDRVLVPGDIGGTCGCESGCDSLDSMDALGSSASCECGRCGLSACEPHRMTAADAFGPFDPDTSDHGGLGGRTPKPKRKAKPKVPWPRYHPIPTRPVFGAPADATGGH